MLSHTSQNPNHYFSKMKCLFIVIIAILSVTISRADGQQMGIQCLLEQPITESCIYNLNIHSIIKMHPQSTVYACPLLVKYCEQNNPGNQQIWKKAELVCKYSTNQNVDSGYTLLGLYLMGESYFNASKLEYQLFFNEPFGHQNKFKQTMNKYQKYLNRNTSRLTQTNNQDANLNKAVLLFYQNQLRNASLLLQSLAIQIKQKSVKQLLQMITIRIFQKQGEFPKALQAVTMVLSEHRESSHWYFHHLKGNLLMHHLKFKQAIRSFQHSISSKTRKQNQRPFPFSLYNIGLCLQKTADFQKSLSFLQRTVVESPHSAQPLNALAFSYYSMMGDQQNKNKLQKLSNSAQNYYKQAIKIDKTYYPTYHNYGTLKFDRKDYAKAIQLFEQAIKLNQQSSTASRYGLFKSLYKMDKQKGMKYLNDEILTNKSNSLGDVGLLFYQLGENKIAKQYLEKAIPTNHNLGEVYEWKGIIQYQMNQYKDAASSFRKALEKGNTKPSIWFNLAHIQQLKHNYDAALGLYKKALEKDPYGPAKEKVNQLRKLIEKKGKHKSHASPQQL